MCIYICVYIYTYMYIYIYIYVCVYIYINIYICVFADYPTSSRLYQTFLKTRYIWRSLPNELCHLLYPTLALSRTLSRMSVWP